MSPHQNTELQFLTRRHLLSLCGYGMGAAALASLLGTDAGAAEPKNPAVDPDHAKASDDKTARNSSNGPHLPAKARSVILLHMAGAPSVLDLLDYKPKLNELDGKPCPDSYVRGQKFAFLRGVPKLLGSPHKFAPHGQSGQIISDLLPHLSKVADDITVIRSMFTDQFNHAPGQLLWYTGFPRPGRPSLGSWVSYGLGSANRDLPTFVALTSGTAGPDGGNALWGSGFLPSVHQGVRLNNRGDPVMFLTNPAGIDDGLRRRSLDALAELNRQRLDLVGDPEIATRISQFEMAYRMQSAVPELLDISREPKSVLDSYGVVPGQRSFAANCLLARRLVEKGVRLVQLHHWGWDSHGDNKDNDIRYGLADRCRETDQPSAALVSDLKTRGLLDSTLVIWGGEFGRTPMNENRGGNSQWLGRDHNQHSFSIWIAGGGSRPGLSYGATDELGYHVADKPVHVYDLQATVLHLLGLDHERLTYRFQGRDFRLTDVHGKPVKDLLA